jgi:phosphatidylinositol alpha-mannosyltransferase
MKNGGSNPPAPGNRSAEPPGGLQCRAGGFGLYTPPPALPLMKRFDLPRDPRVKGGLPFQPWSTALPMRVALVTEFYYPHLGGVTEHVHHLGRELRRRGHEATVITSHMRGEGDDPPYVRRVGTSRVIYANGAFARITTGWRLGHRLERVLREIGADLVHVQDGLAPVLGPTAAGAAHRIGIPAVATFHSWFPRSVAAHVFRRPLQRRLDRLAATIAVSQPVVEALSRYFHASWEVIPNGVDAGMFHPNGRQPTDYRARGPRLLFLGRLDPRNGLDTVLRAMPQILARFPDTRLTVAGDGPLRAWYERNARPLGPAVQFVGRVNGERPEYYGTADLYLCPTTKASFGITLLEAMACATPLVVSDITGFRELVAGGAEARLVPMDDPTAWARAVTELMGDPERRAAMGQAGRAKAATYAWPVIAERLLEVYRRVLR